MSVTYSDGQREALASAVAGGLSVPKAVAAAAAGDLGIPAFTIPVSTAYGIAQAAQRGRERPPETSHEDIAERISEMLQARLAEIQQEVADGAARPWGELSEMLRLEKQLTARRPRGAAPAEPTANGNGTSELRSALERLAGDLEPNGTGGDA